MKGVTILGSTGSVGVNTLEVISRNQNRFGVVALTANTNDALMVEQCQRWQPVFAVMVDEAAAERVDQALQRLLHYRKASADAQDDWSEAGAA